MSDKTDPRLEVLVEPSAVTPGQLLADLDAADRTAGIVRVDTTDEEVVAVVADAEREARASYWDATTPAERAATGVDGVSRHVARAILAALAGDDQ